MTTFCKLNKDKKDSVYYYYTCNDISRTPCVTFVKTTMNSTTEICNP